MMKTNELHNLAVI